eukprot:3855853-Alexandrium_andersonii.AAC.1
MDEHERDIADVREASFILGQWAKNSQKDEAEVQIKLMGWSAESRAERKVVVERWLTTVDAWDHYYT